MADALWNSVTVSQAQLCLSVRSSNAHRLGAYALVSADRCRDAGPRSEEQYHHLQLVCPRREAAQPELLSRPGLVDGNIRMPPGAGLDQPITPDRRGMVACTQL